MATTLQEGLAEFPPSTKTYRLVDGVLSVIPGATSLSADLNLSAIGERLGATPAQLVEAHRIASSDPAIRDILWMSDLIDKADKGYAIFTGLSSAVKMFWGSNEPEPEPEPRRDRGGRPGKRRARRAAYKRQKDSHAIRRYKQLMEMRKHRRLRARERQELRFLQQEIRREVEQRQQEGRDGPPRFPRRAGRPGPPGFPGGPLGKKKKKKKKKKKNHDRFEADWERQPDDEFGDDFDARADRFDDAQTGLAERNAASAWERGLAALETDTQQRNDAIVKALAIAYMAYQAFPGTLQERTQRFVACSTGQNLLVYYAAVEVGLPFADNALLAGGNIMDGLLGDHVEEQVSRLASLAGGRSLGDVSGMLQQLTGWMQTAVDTTAPYIDTVAQSAQEYLPLGANAADKIAGLAANAADVMPCYRLLGARLAAEAAVLQAMDPR